MGQSFARNFAASKSRGDILIFFDDDDVSFPQRSLEHLRLHDEAKLVYVSSSKKYSEVYSKTYTNVRYSGKPKFQDWIESLLLGESKDSTKNLWIPASTMSISANFFREINGFDSELRRQEDTDLFLRSLLNEASVAWSERILVQRNHSAGPDKNELIEANATRQILKLYGDYLTQRQIREVSKIISLREYYFGGNVMSLFGEVFKSLFVLFRRPARFRNIYKRVFHDLRRLIS
jgi:glycosyltransferase involved in cell wall biosynthesis